MNMYINDYWFLPDKKRIGKKLRDFRNSFNMSVNDVAFELQCDDKTIYKWENGSTMPSIENLVKMKKIYNASFEELILPDKGLPKDFFVEKNTSNNYNSFIFQVSCKDIKINSKSKFQSTYNEYVMSQLNKQKRFNVYSDYFIQKLLFSFENIKHSDFYNDIELNGFDELRDNTKYNEFNLKIKNIYGIDYKVNLNLKTKNAILYEYYKFAFCFYEFGIYSSEFLYNTFDELYSLLNEDLFEYGVLLIESLPQLSKEVFYNSLLKVSKIVDVNLYLKYLEDHKCNKYKFVDGIEIDETNDVKNCFKQYVLLIVKYLLKINYDTYLIERGDINE